MFGAITGIGSAFADLGLTGLDVASTTQQLQSGSIDTMIQSSNTADTSASELQRQYVASSQLSNDGAAVSVSSSSSILVVSMIVSMLLLIVTI